MRVEIIREDRDGLSRKVYTYWLSEWLELQLDCYAEQSRETKRHKYRLTANWLRLMRRDCKIKEKPAVPDDVIAEALALARSAIVAI